MKRLISMFLAAAMLCAAALPVRAQEPTEGETNQNSAAEIEAPQAAELEPAELETAEFEPEEETAELETAELKTADVSGYPSITLAGGSHALYLDEHGPNKAVVYNPQAVPGIVKEYIPGIVKAILKFDYNGVVDLIVEALHRIFGDIAMDENGESITEGITCDRQTFKKSNINSDQIFFGFDWRLDPMENAEKLHDFVAYIRARRKGIEKFNFVGTSGSGGVMLAYMKLYGYDDIASLVMNISLHNGLEMFGALATGNVSLGAEALGKIEIDLSAMGLDWQLQPWLRLLYESGLFSIISKTTKSGIRPWVRPTYDRGVIPALFMMPGYWSFVPPEDYEAAKAYIFREDPEKYAGLIKKLDRYHDEVAEQADELILEANKRFKVAVRSGYGKPSWPLGDDTGVQGDGMVETVRSSIGATGAPLDEPFLFFYEQKIDDGHDHISPDRYIDASTCLLPEQTWFTYNLSHKWEISYSGWYEWWLAAENPTVFDNEEFPQFSEMLEPGVYVPREAAPQSKVLSVLKAGGLGILKAWRWVLQLPLFWVKWWYQSYV